MKRLPSFVRLALCATAFAPLTALAHPGHEGDHGLVWDFSGGFAHPLTGIDHLLAMVAVGLWAAQLGGRARWLVPTAFVAMMSVAAAFARTGIAFPGLEQGIAASVLALGLLMATATKLPVGAGMALVGLFAIFHGYAHGTEMPAGAQAAGFGIGFVFATALLHAAGLGLGVLVQARSEKLTRAVGWAIAGGGVILLAA